MKFLIQTIKQEVVHDFSWHLIQAIKYQDWLGNPMEYEFFDTNDKGEEIVFSEQCKDLVPIGSVEFVSGFLKQFYGITPKPINVPKELMGYTYSRRLVENVKACEIKKESGSFVLYNKFGDKYDYKTDIIFIKSNDKIKDKFSGVINTEAIIPEGNYQISTVLSDILSEWRVFVFKGKIVGIHRYSGDFKSYPNFGVLKMFVQYYENCPVAYTLDVACTRNLYLIDGCNPFAVIEVHDFFSCGLYGFSDYNNLPFMFSQWFYEYLQKNCNKK